jgi:heme exporter protein B
VPPDLFRASALVARKDLTIEFRTRTAFFAAAAFTLLAIVIFFFAWDPTAVSAIDLAPGVLWVIFTFSGLLGLQRSFNVEHADGAMDALLAAPIAREAIYLGKAGANLVFVLAVQALAIPAVALFYNAPLGRIAGGLAAIAVLAAIGLVAVGTLFSAIAANTRMAELLLPVVVLPFFVPIVMAAAQATSRLLAGRPLSEATGWLQLLGAYDLVFVAACMLAFPYTLDE